MKRLTLLTIGILLLLGAQNLNAQEMGVGLGYTDVIPLPKLSSRFEPVQGLTYEATFPRDESTELAFFYRDITFDKINTKKMYFDTLRMSLQVKTLALDYTYSPLKFGRFAKFNVSIGAGLNRWYSHRYPFVGQDSTAEGVESINAQEFSRNDWSWSGRLGIAVDIMPVRLVTVGAALHYELIVASLWPATKLRMSIVSGWHLLEPRLYLRFNIPSFR